MNWADRASVLAAVKKDGRVLARAPLKIRTDKEVALAALTHGNFVMGYIHKTLYNDADVMLAAVKLNGNYLQFAHDSLLYNHTIVLAAIAQNTKVILHIKNALFQDPEFIRGLCELPNLQDCPHIIKYNRILTLSLNPIILDDILRLAWVKVVWGFNTE